jgi:endogenous inhibitor of DNA gyrase (YacG/DUF329 family)
MSKNTLNVKCPTCDKKFSYYESKFRPFCAERCKMVDMGKWLEESYTIAGRDNSVYIEDSELLNDLLDDDNESY